MLSGISFFVIVVTINITTKEWYILRDGCNDFCYIKSVINFKIIKEFQYDDT